LCSDILYMAHLWLAGALSHSIQQLTSHSSSTVSSFLGHFRSLVASSLEDEHNVIGGPNVIVEVDESKMGKRNYNRGHRVDGVWIVSGVERTPERKVFLRVVENRSANTLLGILGQHVAPGSLVYTDLWKGYCKINERLGLDHYTVNHSLHFKDPTSGVHTNTIEGSWNGLKMKISARNRVKDGMEDKLLKFIWRRRHSNSLWEGFICALREIRYDLQ
jgi:hypothetical protein